MNESTPNPYTTPEADVTPTAPDGDPFADFPRFSAWWVFLLSVVTFGIYAYYWIITRTDLINKALPENPISPALIWTVIGIAVWQFISGAIAGAAPGTVSEGYLTFTLLIDFVNFVLWIFLVFAIRGRINQMTGARPGSPFWSNGILTFFFTPIYPAYKINQIKDAHGTL